VDLQEEASILYNRGRVHEARREWTLAEADYSRALALRGDDAPHILRHRALCRREARISARA
jgi:lipoprotein NlpI